MTVARIDSGTAGRRRRLLALLLPALCYLLFVPYAAVHVDFARDVFVALRVIQGQEFPLQGPLLAGSMHLGPLWYYALAGLLFCGAGWLGLVTAVGAVGALQFPLVYLAGKALHSRRAGLVWAYALLLPSWSTFENLFPQYTQLTATSVAAAALCALRFARGGKPRYFVLLAVACALALHAHPSTVGLLWIALAATAVGLRRGALSLGIVALAVGLATLPFLPMLIDQIDRGMPMLDAVNTYFVSSQGQTDLGVMPQLLAQVVTGGTRYWFESMLGGGPSVGTGVSVVLYLLVAGAVVGLGVAFGDRTFRGRGLIALAIVLAVVATTVMLRAHAPYYMSTTSRVLVLGLLAVGIARLIGPRTGMVLGMAAVSAQLLVVAFVGNVQSRGALPFAIIPLFAVNSSAQPLQPITLMPAYAMQRSGRFLCAGDVALHGTYAWHVLHGYALEARFDCAAATMQIGGDRVDAREHWIGIPRSILRDAGILPQQSLGPLGLLRVRRVHGQALTLYSPDAPTYPPLPVATTDPRTREFEVILGADEHLAISNLAFPFAPDPQVRIRVNGVALAAIAGNRVLQLWRCADCGSEPIRVEVDAADFEHLDVVTF